MKKAIATTALAALLAVALSGCTFGLLQPGNPADQPYDEVAEPVAPRSDEDVEMDESTIAGSGDVESYFCEDGESLEVTNTSYDGGLLSVTGACSDVTISADNLTVFIDSAISVSVPGYYNTVDLASSVSDVTVTGDMASLTGGNVASLHVDGYANTVTFTSADSVTVGGSENFVSWFGGASSGADTGTDNTLLAP